MLSAAGSLRWFLDALAPGVDFGELVAAAGEVPPGSDGLLFLPYLTGERSPHPDPLARGAFVGLTVRHDRRHLTRAVAVDLMGSVLARAEANLPFDEPSKGVEIILKLIAGVRRDLAGISAQSVTAPSTN